MGNIRNLYVTLLVLVVCVFCYGQETHQKFKIKLAALSATKAPPAPFTEEPRSGLRYHHNPRTCGEADLCCNGQNNTCFVFGRRLDANTNESRCYCDSNCYVMSDCCVDYHEHCKAIDCDVSDWTDWGECDNPCGLGSRRRTRKVKRYPENGGKNCPTLKQRRVCVGDSKAEECLQQSVEHHAEELQETGRILPAAYGIFRTSSKYDPWKGILKNLYGRNFNEILTRATYCAYYLVTSSRAACNSTEVNQKWARSLNKGAEVCVECQPTAMDRDRGVRCIGHGVMNKLTRWTAINVPHCKGEWTMTVDHKPCTCDRDEDPDDDPADRDGPTRNFIFI
ncbi:somatomedin-B and thrombospondin type-1 domain-containing protein-like [Haliotis rubra]|uniref:somatomedin-B and thrombospondin type-1 domain-containing protein-like n=1 Tax=Haliotis rubra TaxID=36100 RepID=UPI001EE60943|nr:somatomedin-B and thrombospondin type-1 domain-containing protein-like [Haliotis rubra]